MQTNVVAVALKSWLAIKYSHIADEMQSLLQKYAAKKRWAGHQKRLLRFRRSRTDSAAEQAKEAVSYTHLDVYKRQMLWRWP